MAEGYQSAGSGPNAMQLRLRDQAPRFGRDWIEKETIVMFAIHTILANITYYSQATNIKPTQGSTLDLEFHGGRWIALDEHGGWIGEKRLSCTLFAQHGLAGFDCVPDADQGRRVCFV